MSVIDHTAHPAIIDTILSRCSVTALLAFRNTNRTYRDKLTRKLYHHAVLHTSQNTHKAIKSGAPPIAVRLGVAPTCNDVRDVHLPWLPGAVRILDVRTPVWERIRPYIPQFTNVHTVRKLRPTEWVDCPLGPEVHFPACTTIVEYFGLTNPGHEENERPDIYFKGPATRWVFHIGLRGERYSGFWWHRVLAPQVVDAVVVLHGTAAPEVVYDIVYWAHKAMLYDIWYGQGSLTVVGALEALDGDAEVLDNLKAQLVETLAHLDYDDDDLPSHPAAESLTRFITTDEWLAELGDEQRDIEAAWPVPLQSDAAWRLGSAPTVRPPRRRLAVWPLDAVNSCCEVDKQPPPIRHSARYTCVSHARQLRGLRHCFR